MKEQEFETTFRTVENQMIQTFSDQVRIIADFKHDKVTIFINDEPKVTAQMGTMLIKEFLILQKHAADAARQLDKLSQTL